MLLQQSLSLKQQELLVNIGAEAVLVFPEDRRVDFFMTLSNSIITLVNSRSAVEEGNSIISAPTYRVRCLHFG